MDIASIRLAAQARPFQPFWLVLAGGETVKVAHPDFIGFSPSGRTVVVEAESSHLLDTSSIVRLEVDSETEIDPKVEEIRQAVQTATFRPFTIRLSDGRTFVVPAPQYVVVSPGGRKIVYFRPEDDTTTVLDPPFIRDLELLPARVETGTGS